MLQIHISLYTSTNNIKSLIIDLNTMYTCVGVDLFLNIRARLSGLVEQGIKPTVMGQSKKQLKC